MANQTNFQPSVFLPGTLLCPHFSGDILQLGEALLKHLQRVNVPQTVFCPQIYLGKDVQVGVVGHVCEVGVVGHVCEVSVVGHAHNLST